MDSPNKEHVAIPDALPKGTGFDSARQTTIAAGRCILASYPELPEVERARLVRAFRSILIPQKKPGRKLKAEITAAFEDYRRGIRGLALYRTHIVGWDKMSRWRRQGESKRLMESIRTRLRRQSTKAGIFHTT